jgi:predicted nuclease of predicted toxin-antitoxin system
MCARPAFVADRISWSGSTRDNGFTIVSKDTDFRDRSDVEGFPPKVIWLDVAKAGTDTIVEILKRHRSALFRFDASAESSLLILSLSGTAI